MRARGAVLGLAGIETGPGVIITVFIGAGVGSYLGEEGVEAHYESVFNEQEKTDKK